ncbi:MAG: AAA family ATPase, partial [Prevotella sp.]|nr:AAA family ATPase [Prevotella sp.]
MPNIVYPIGIQSFSKLRNGNCYYVDKTALVHELVTTGYYYFLSRPRRFGKSLLISTLHEYFKGNRELFKGLAIDRLEPDEWPCHPVLHIDFNGRNYVKYPEILTRHLHTTLLKWADELEIQINRELTPDEMFSELIERAVEKT